MANLRGKGYPSSRSQAVVRQPNDLVSRNNNGALYAGTSNESRTNPTASTQLLSKLITAYNNKAYAHPKAPMIGYSGFDYINGDGEKAYNEGIALRPNNGTEGRYGFIGRDVSESGTNYTAGIDNLPFGENVYDKSIVTPVGTFNINYDGDTTATLGYNSSPRSYYANALLNLLRGQR